MLRIIRVLLFFHFNVFGQNEEMITYNESKEELYKCLNLESFQYSTKEFHLRLNIQGSVILDIWKDDGELKGNAYSYVLQESKYIINGVSKNTDTLFYKMDTLSLDQIKSIIENVESMYSNYAFGCFLQPRFSILVEKKINEDFSTDQELLYYFTSFDYQTFQFSYKSDLPPGKYVLEGGLGWSKFHPFSFQDKSLPSEFANRENPRKNLFSNWESNLDFQIKDNQYRGCGGMINWD